MLLNYFLLRKFLSKITQFILIKVLIEIKAILIKIFLRHLIFLFFIQNLVSILY